MRIAKTLPLVALAALVAVPALASDPVIFAGLDLWRTVPGSTHSSFADAPIPAGFFCPGSAPFGGDIGFRGVPLATDVLGALSKTDTIVHRLDDATFDAKGVATTRIQVRAMQFAGLKPVETSCGTYRVKVVLDGEQPVTTMKILRDTPYDGRFEAPIAVNVRLVFVPISAPGGRKSVTRSLVFAPNPAAVWVLSVEGAGIERPVAVRVDSDGDSRPDLDLPGLSNFVVGWRLNEPARRRLKAGSFDPFDPGNYTEQTITHCADPPDCTKEHETQWCGSRICKPL